MPIYTFSTEDGDILQVISPCPRTGKQQLAEELSVSPESLTREYRSPANAIFKKTGNDRVYSRKSTFRRPGK